MLITILIFLNIVLIRRIKFLPNPFTLLSFLFFFPAILATLSLSDYQFDTPWDTHTYLLLGNSFIAWGLIPFFYLYKLGN